VCVCHRVRLGATVILYTYNDKVERKKERKEERKKERKKEFSIIVFIFIMYDFSGSNCVSNFR